ncbi:MAG: hypothetical protein ACFFBD_15800 [Candidatus Hodarchaeota archaeon]
MNESYNPYLKKAILEIVENQIKDNNPPETKKTLNRLMKNGYSRKEAIGLIGSAIGDEIYEMLKFHRPFDKVKFVDASNELR